MNVYIKDSKTKHLYARLRNVDRCLYRLLTDACIETGCIVSVLLDYRSFRSITIYVNGSISVDMHGYVRRIVSNARLQYKHCNAGVK